MSEHWRNFPFKVTREAAIGYALYFVLFKPGPMSWGLVIGGGTALFCIIAAIEVRIVRRRQRNRDDEPLAADSGASEG